jgi:hypothetical protein
MMCVKVTLDCFCHNESTQELHLHPQIRPVSCYQLHQVTQISNFLARLYSPQHSKMYWMRLITAMKLLLAVVSRL